VVSDGNGFDPFDPLGLFKRKPRGRRAELLRRVSGGIDQALQYSEELELESESIVEGDQARIEAILEGLLIVGLRVSELDREYRAKGY